MQECVSVCLFFFFSLFFAGVCIFSLFLQTLREGNFRLRISRMLYANASLERWGGGGGGGLGEGEGEGTTEREKENWCGASRRGTCVALLSRPARLNSLGHVIKLVLILN